jgi:hypothetical protein
LKLNDLFILYILLFSPVFFLFREKEFGFLL